MTPDAFLTYLTVFKSRLGLANLMLQLSGFVHQPDAALLRKLDSVLEQTRELRLDDPNNDHVFQYLKDKRFIGREARATGRYTNYAALELVGGHWRVVDRQGEPVSTLDVYMTDAWLSNPDIPSTIGVPTPDNARETFEFPFQLGLLSKSTNTWTASGQLTNGLRTKFADLLSDKTNPLLLGVEAVSLLRQIINVDGLILTEVVRTLAESKSGLVSRDAVAAVFPAIVDRAVRVARAVNLAPPAMREAVDFLRRVRKSDASRTRGLSKGRTPSRAPGLLEHRVSPRLEWLTELGYLTKNGLAKNGFDYRVTDALHGLLADLDSLASAEDQAEEVAIRQWTSNPIWARLHKQVATQPWPTSVRVAYELMRRRIGPAPLREVAFVVSMITAGDRMFRRSLADLIDFAQSTKGASLSGGRYQRTPENIFLADSAMANE